MSLLRLRETTEVPPEGYRSVDQEDGFRVGPYNAKADWLNAVERHKRDNGYPLPENWREEAEDQLARILPPGWAYYRDTGEMATLFVNARIGGEDILNGTKALLALVRKVAAFKLFGLESPIVSQEEAEARALTCSRCIMNGPIEGCFSCYGLAELIEEVAVGITTPTDHLLKSCLVCKCANKAQTRLKAEVLKEHTSQEQLAIFDSLPHCWKGKSLRALSS